MLSSRGICNHSTLFTEIKIILFRRLVSAAVIVLAVALAEAGSVSTASDHIRFIVKYSKMPAVKDSSLTVLYNTI